MEVISGSQGNKQNHGYNGTIIARTPFAHAIPLGFFKIATDLKDYFFSIPLHPQDQKCFAFSLPSTNFQAPMQRFQWMFSLKEWPTQLLCARLSWLLPYSQLEIVGQTYTSFIIWMTSSWQEIIKTRPYSAIRHYRSPYRRLDFK